MIEERTKTALVRFLPVPPEIEQVAGFVVIGEGATGWVC